MLQGLDGVRNLADDIIIFAKTREDHDQALSDCFKRVANHGLTLNASKCKLLAESLSFFGQVFTAEGMTLDPALILDLQTASVPTDVHEVRSFLGMANYSNKYIPNNAAILEPLRVLTKKTARFTWNASHQTAFDKLKRALTRTSTMSYFDAMKDTVDASPVGISAILTQKGTDADTSQVVAYASHALTSVEQRYSQTEKEALGIVWSNAAILEPLQVLTKKTARFTWNASHQTAFDKLKRALTRTSTMSYFDAMKDTVDASPVGISAILTQKGTDADTSQVVAYASHALTSVEQRYSQTEKEALGIVWSNAAILEPLRVLTKKTARFTWNASHQTAFDKLKRALTRTSTMSYFDAMKDTVDASPVGISAILTQKGTDADTSQVIAYASHALTSIEQRYSQTEKEALRIVWSIKYFHLYI